MNTEEQIKQKLYDDFGVDSDNEWCVTNDGTRKYPRPLQMAKYLTKQITQSRNQLIEEFCKELDRATNMKQYRLKETLSNRAGVWEAGTIFDIDVTQLKYSKGVTWQDVFDPPPH